MQKYFSFELLFIIFVANNSLFHMSPRLKRIRKISNPPIIKGFKPYGLGAGNQAEEPVNLLFEEYEALRLSDYDKLNHQQASVMMGVSRPTFTRIYASALQKIARAFVEGAQIAIEGGKVYFDSDWYKCHTCDCFFNNPHKDFALLNCPLCGSHQIKQFDYSEESIQDTTKIYDNACICPQCGYQQEHQAGNPCKSVKCQNCGSLMMRKRNAD